MAAVRLITAIIRDMTDPIKWAALISVSWIKEEPVVSTAQTSITSTSSRKDPLLNVIEIAS